MKDGKCDDPKFTYYCSDKTVYYFDNYTGLREFRQDIYDGLISLDEARKERTEMQTN